MPEVLRRDQETLDRPRLLHSLGLHADLSARYWLGTLLAHIVPVLAVTHSRYVTPRYVTPREQSTDQPGNT